MNKKKIIIDIKTIIILMLTATAAVSIAAVAVLASVLIKDTQQPPKLSSAAVMEKISQISELAVNKIEYRDIVRYKSGEIPVLTKKECTMIYNAEVKVGIDFSDIKVKTDNNIISITLPEAEILDIVIDENSLEFYDEKFAVFNWQDRYDTVELLKYAKENITEKTMESGILNSTKEEAGRLIKSILEPMTENLEAEIIIK